MMRYHYRITFARKRRNVADGRHFYGEATPAELLNLIEALASSNAVRVDVYPS